MPHLLSSHQCAKRHSFFHFIPFIAFIIFLHSSPISSQSSLCRTSCGGIPINYPFGLDDGCGHPDYRRLLICSDSSILYLWTPSGRYPVRSISYTDDPHVVIHDPFMWTCQDGPNFRPTRPFSLDTSTHLKLSHQNEYLFFNCSEDHVLIGPRPVYCDRFPERCDSKCDSASFLCRHVPECDSKLNGGGIMISCCSYFPRATTSLRLMLEYCGSYTSVYWRKVGAAAPYDQVAEYGIRVEFEIPISLRCLVCEEPAKGGGTCGFDTESEEFLCLCEQANVTTYCKDHRATKQGENTGAIAGAVGGVSAAGAIGVGAGLWYLKKKAMRANAPVTYGVQSTENRLF